MSHTYYFGILKNTYAADRRQIAVLGVFETHPQHDVQVPVNGFQDFVGPTGCVHWYLNDGDEGEFNKIGERSPVRFRCDEQTKNLDETKDRRRVYFMHVEPCGAFVLPESLCNGWETGEATIPLSLPTCPVFIQSADGKSLLGPWRMKEKRDEIFITPRKPPTVYRYDLSEVRRKGAIQVYRHPSVEDISVIGVSEIPFAGEPVDVATPTQLSNWLKKKLNQVISAQRIKELDTAYPGWKKGLADAVKDAKPDEQQRWKRVEECLDSVLADAEAIEAIQQTGSYQEYVSQAVANEIRSRKLEIENEAERLTKEKTKPLEREIARLERKKAEIADEIESEEHRLERPVQELTRLRESLAGDFDRLKSESAILSSLLGQPPRSDKTQSSADRPSFNIRPDEETSFTEVDLSSFLASRFHPSLSESMIGLAAPDARNALVTVLGSRAVLLPDAKWFFAFCKAFNAESEVAYCDPRWLTWADAWRDLGNLWAKQSGSPSWKFILIQDFNIALPELWARPLLNVIAGVTQALPNNSTWPERVRLFLVPTLGEAALPVCHEVLTHFAAIKLTGKFSTSDSKREFAGFEMCEVRRPSKLSAIVNVRLADEVLPTASVLDEKMLPKINAAFDPVLPGVVNDVSTVSRLLVEMGVDEDEAVEIALSMRCGWILSSEETK